MHRARWLVGFVLLVTSLGAAGPAGAQSQLFNDFKNHGTITPCKYSDQQLQSGLNGLPPDIQQYAPGYADSLNAARQAACGGGGAAPAAKAQTTQQSPAAPASSGGGGTPPTPRPQISPPPSPKPKPLSRLAKAAVPHVSTAPTAGDEAPPWLVIVLLALAVVGVGSVLLVRYRGPSSERVTRPLRASLAEAGGRTADAFASLWDRARPGR